MSLSFQLQMLRLHTLYSAKLGALQPFSLFQTTVVEQVRELAFAYEKLNVFCDRKDDRKQTLD